ncbi:MAG: hypothetical protein HY954_12725 [Deltaproteobacteria bacterium]|nr:hypothetical protein [Deltaproteobacteria bacterium]
MFKKIKYLNIIIIIISIPLTALLAKDYLAYRYASRPAPPPQTDTAPPAAAGGDIHRYASIVEAPVFPSKVRTLTQIEMIEAGDGVKGGAGLPSIVSELKLLGTYVGPESFAIFEKAGAPNQGVFKIGEAVFEAGKLKKVMDEKAVIQIGAKEITFSIPVNELPPPPFSPPTDVPSQAKGGLSRKLGENEWVIDQNAVVNSLDNMSTILTDARMTPKITKGAVEGFTVTEIKPKGVFDAIGLKNGDMLTRINGYGIDSPEKAVQVLSGLKGETSIDLDIVRGGKNMSFHYQIR